MDDSALLEAHGFTTMMEARTTTRTAHSPPVAYRWGEGTLERIRHRVSQN